jgi:hypothetical protein
MKSSVTEQGPSDADREAATEAKSMAVRSWAALLKSAAGQPSYPIDLLAKRINDIAVEWWSCSPLLVSVSYWPT